MNETIDRTASPTSTEASDDVWGVNRPPALPPNTAAAGTGTHGTGAGTGGASGPTRLDRGFTVLKRSPLRRDSARGAVGGVSAGIARRLDVSLNAVRVAAVVLALFFGLGIGAYLVAWAALPDEHGRTHAEQAVRHGRPGSMAVVTLAALPVLGVLVGVIGNGWPLLLAVAAVALVVSKRKGHLSHPVRG